VALYRLPRLEYLHFHAVQFKLANMAALEQVTPSESLAAFAFERCAFAGEGEGTPCKFRLAAWMSSHAALQTYEFCNNMTIDWEAECPMQWSLEPKPEQRPPQICGAQLRWLQECWVGGAARPHGKKSEKMRFEGHGHASGLGWQRMRRHWLFLLNVRLFWHQLGCVVHRDEVHLTTAER
jgi:hypothetical protein